MTSSNESSVYVIYCIDAKSDSIVELDGRRKGGLHRLQCMESHKQYQLETSTPGPSYIHKVTAAPMLGPDGSTIIGSCFLVKSTREAAERFVANDPLCKNQVWSDVSINRFSAAGKTQEEQWGSIAKAKAATAAHLYQPRRV